ncbi:MAG: hypothetical protein AAB600_01700 [Patescibacteria group bacterium]
MFKKLFIFLVFLIVFLFVVNSSFASTFYISPRSANIPSGSIVSVSVGLNTNGESINGISAYLSYPSDKLEVAWISYGGAFSLQAEGSYGGGGIRISRGSIPGAVGNVNVATIGFRGKAQGTATVSFIGGSAAVRTSDGSDSLNLGGSSGAVFTIGAAKPGSSTTVSPPTKVSPTITVDTTKPVISNVKVDLIATNTATITWQTDEKANSTVDYGLSADKYFINVNDNNLTTAHTIKLTGDSLTPGTVINFRVKSKDGAGNEEVSNNITFQLKGYTVIIKVLDTANKPIKDAEVLLYTPPVRSITSLSGETIFTNVTPGKHLVVAKLNNNLEKTKEIDVEDSLLSQSFFLNIDTQSNQVTSTILYFVILVTIVGATGIYVVVRKRVVG